MEKSYSVFHIEGGLGKHVAATAVAKCIKKNHPERELIVVCAWPEVFINLKYVDRVYRVGNTPYFYQDYIKNQDSLIFKHEPYFTTDHVHKKLKLIENWCKLYNLNYTGETPEIVFNTVQTGQGHRMWVRNKPIMVIQTNGGPFQEQPYNYSWTRDMPYELGLALVERYKEQYHIIQICRKPEQALPGVEVISNNMSNMELFSLLLFSTKQVLIDSCLQHAAAALEKKSTVIWFGTSPKIFGYTMHDNIVASLPEDFNLPDSYLFDYNFTGTPHECPIIDTSVIDINEIFSSIEGDTFNN
jgi:hypothetical protein